MGGLQLRRRKQKELSEVKIEDEETRFQALFCSKCFRVSVAHSCSLFFLFLFLLKLFPPFSPLWSFQVTANRESSVSVLQLCRPCSYVSVLFQNSMIGTVRTPEDPQEKLFQSPLTS